MTDEIHYNTWDQFKTHFRERLTTHDSKRQFPFVFRGQSNSAWRLEPSFSRAFRHVPSTAFPKVQRQLLANFHKDIKLAGLKPPQSNSTGGKASMDTALWSRGQHYGLPTPLLDWSESPYVAALMAYEGVFDRIVDQGWASNRKQMSALTDRLAIYALRRDENTWRKLGVKFLEFLDADNPRIRSQLGLFTLLPPNRRSLEHCLELYAKGPSKRKAHLANSLLSKFTLPYNSALDAIKDLESMDITPRRLYADYEGVCKSTKLRTRVDFF